MPGMAISSWPSRKRASRELIARTWAGCRREYKRAAGRRRATAPSPRGSPHCDCSPPRIPGYRPPPGPVPGLVSCACLLAALALCAAPRSRRPPSAARGRGGRPAVGADRRLARARRQPARRDRDPPRARLAHLLAGAGRAPASRRASTGRGRATSPRSPTSGRGPRSSTASGLRDASATTAPLVLPVRLTPARPAAPIELELALDFGVCDDICVPAEAQLDARLAPDAAGRRAARAIEAALAERARRRRRGRRGAASPARSRRTAGGYALTARDHLRRSARPGPGRGARARPARPLDRRGREPDRGPHRHRPRPGRRRRRRRPGRSSAGRCG